MGSAALMLAAGAAYVSRRRGGAGVLASLCETPRWQMVMTKALELLHDGQEGCQKACYDCLCTFYNQLDHVKLDRQAVLPWLRRVQESVVERQRPDDNARFEALWTRCQSDLERLMLTAIREAGLPLPLAAQKLIDAAHQVCPYSNATRGNIDVNITLA